MSAERVTCWCGQLLIGRQYYIGGHGYVSRVECRSHSDPDDGHICREVINADYDRWLGYTAEREGDLWIVRTPQGKRYTVDLEARTCDCVYWHTIGYKFRRCKHLNICESKAREEKEAMNNELV